MEYSWVHGRDRLTEPLVEASAAAQMGSVTGIAGRDGQERIGRLSEMDLAHVQRPTRRGAACRRPSRPAGVTSANIASQFGARQSEPFLGACVPRLKLGSCDSERWNLQIEPHRDGYAGFDQHLAGHALRSSATVAHAVEPAVTNCSRWRGPARGAADDSQK